MKKKDNLILVGMPASGKSTVGVILAKVIGYDFIDSDLLIQRREGMRLPEIIEQKGIEGFIAIENEVNASIDASRSVIANRDRRQRHLWGRGHAAPARDRSGHISAGGL